MEKIKQGLIQLFLDAADYQPKFKKKMYEDAFLSYYESHKELIEQMITLLNESEQPEKLIAQWAKVIPEFAFEEIQAIPKKRKKDLKILDFSLQMISFVFPVFAYADAKVLAPFNDAMVEEWNRLPVDQKLKWTTYDTLKNGFTKRLCYITTAVCSSQKKSDDCQELQMLRAYRDEYLMKEAYGKQMVEEYYDIAPSIVKKIDKREDAKEIYEQIYQRYLVPCLSLLEEDKKEECFYVYRDMVTELKNTYIYS